MSDFLRGRPGGAARFGVAALLLAILAAGVGGCGLAVTVAAGIASLSKGGTSVTTVNVSTTVQIVLVPRGSSDEAYADCILAAAKSPMAKTPFDFAGWWQDVARAISAQL